MESFKKYVGNRIRAYRKAAGFATQGDLANVMAIDQSRVSRWETGENLPKGVLRERLLHHLKASDGEIFGIPDTANQTYDARNLPPEDVQAVVQAAIDRALGQRLIDLEPEEIELVGVLRSARPEMRREFIDHLKRLIDADNANNVG